MSQMGSAGNTDYCASKWAINGFHESLRLEIRRLGKNNIRTLLVCPYAVDTGMFNGMGENSCLTTLMPLLKTEIVVENIFKAMCSGDDLLIGCANGILGLFYPWAAWILHALPPKLMDAIAGVMGGTNGMDTFRGRNTTKMM